MIRSPRLKLRPAFREAIRASLQAGKKPLQVCVEHDAAYATVVRIQREVREGKEPTKQRA